jgi:DNA-binding NtrC family response regulator
MCLARILVVDDDDDTRQLLAYALGKSYDVVQAADAAAALALLRQGAFDLVLTDYDMPGETGADLLQRATAEGVLGDAATLVVTAHPNPEGVPDEVPLLRKPLDLEQLLVQIRTIVPARPEAAAPRSEPKAGAAIDLVLYVSPRSAASDRARRRMQEVLADCGTEGIHYEVCDLFKNADSAERDRVVFTPTLVKRAPSPRVWIVGDLSEDGLVRDLLAMCGARRRSS